MAKQRDVIYNGSIALPERLAVALINKAGAEGTAHAGVIFGLAQGALEEMAEGGIMLSPVAMERIEQALESADEDTIVEACEKSAGRHGAQYSVSVEIDPMYIEPLRQNAEGQGMTLDKFCSEVVNYAMDQGWFFTEVPAHVARMSAEEYESIGVAIGKPEWTVADLVDHLFPPQEEAASEAVSAQPVEA